MASLVTLEQSILPGFIPPKPLDRFIKGAGWALGGMVMGNCCWQSALLTDSLKRAGPQYQLTSSPVLQA